MTAGSVRPRKVPRRLSGQVGVELGQAADVRLVDDAAVEADAGRSVVAPAEGAVDDAGLEVVGGAVALVIGEVVPGLHLVAEQGRVPLELADDGFGVGIEQELVGVEPVAVLGVIGAVHAVAVDCTGAGIRQVAVEDLVRVFGQLDAFDLGLALVVEQAELDLVGVGGEQREVYPRPVPGGPKRRGAALAKAGFTGGLVHAGGSDGHGHAARSAA